MITRFAPSLTGYLHLGHVLHMIYVWGLSRKYEAEVLCRIEDHDRSRARPEFEAAIYQSMKWLGFYPDLGVFDMEQRPSAFRQSDSEAHYQAVLNELANRGLVYGCECSRKQIAENQPEEAEELVYGGTCAEKGLPLEGNTVRFRTRKGEAVFQDLKLGEQRQRPEIQCGDFSLRDRNGQWTYQFACVCDDIRHSVDLVVRGEDILFSTARQLQLFQILEKPAPRFYHHPLITDSAGKKLSKRQRSESITQLRESGVSAEEVIGRAAHAGKLIPEFQPLTAVEAMALIN